MRLITTIGLALLLVFAIGAAAHGSAELTSQAAPSVVMTASGDSSVVADEATSVAEESSPSSELDPATGAVLCVLGILCGLVAAVLLYRMLYRDAGWAFSTAVRTMLSSAPTARPTPRRMSLPLTALGLSRT
ncbi:hypothetical protein A4X16_02065 [Microbacterium sp. H83]|nr:hypothetical protein A4X16_02065 [Microbacterium sp. H83]